MRTCPDRVGGAVARLVAPSVLDRQAVNRETGSVNAAALGSGGARADAIV